MEKLINRLMGNPVLLVTACGIVVFIDIIVGNNLFQWEGGIGFIVLLALISAIFIIAIPITIIDWAIAKKSSPCCHPMILYGINTFLGVTSQLVAFITYLLVSRSNFQLHVNSIVYSQFWAGGSFLFCLIKLVFVNQLFEGKVKRNLILTNILLCSIMVTIFAILACIG